MSVKQRHNCVALTRLDRMHAAWDDGPASGHATHRVTAHTLDSTSTRAVVICDSTYAPARERANNLSITELT